ncbi:D-aminopeptidase [Streptomyces davaonensis JCM 4913]|uniref:D-aminopeptidase n=2 Tax=Streptomyces davaonensis TaxID=348043 RepID=K4QW69_STRDJ|nr:D-aminopeptidase [Streptomyces davaonensis JCM 4913]
MMAEDVNAAVRGALAAGAIDITVNDAHGPMRNILPESLHPAARLIRGKPKHMGMLEGLTPDHDAMLCVGYHSRAGALGVLSHSFMGHEIEDIWLNGRCVGEIALAQAAAAALGVPVAVLTGDDRACEEMTEWDTSVTTVPVKYARDRFAADLRPADEAREAIEEAVTAALSVDRTPAAPPPADSTLTVRWQSSSVASTLLGIPGVTATDTRTVQAQGTLPALYRLFGVWMRVATSLTNQAPYC